MENDSKAFCVGLGGKEMGLDQYMENVVMKKDLENRLGLIEALMQSTKELCHMTTTGNLPHHITNIEANANAVLIQIECIKREEKK